MPRIFNESNILRTYVTHRVWPHRLRHTRRCSTCWADDAMRLSGSWIHKKAFLDVPPSILKILEIVNWLLVDSVPIQTVPSVNHTLRKEEFSHIQPASMFCQLQIMPSCLSVAANFKHIAKGHCRDFNIHLVHFQYIRSVSPFLKLPPTEYFQPSF